MDRMGILRTRIHISGMRDNAVVHELADVMVDTGSEYSWIPSDLLDTLGVTPVRSDRFLTADGRIVERPVGFAVISVAGRSAATMVVFANSSESTLLGAHGLEGLNLRVDLNARALLPAGPMPAAAA